MSNWISVGDRLPESDVSTLLVSIKIHNQSLIDSIGEYVTDTDAFEVGSGFRFWGCQDDATVTHWQPLPLPPED